MSLAWFLEDSNHEVVLYERNATLGGHAHTIQVAVGKGEYPVDTAFAYLSRPMYPHYLRLLSELGVGLTAVPATFTVRDRRKHKSLLVTPYKNLRRIFASIGPKNLYRMSQFARAIDSAVGFETHDDWNTTVQAWLYTLPDQYFAQRMMLPILASVMGTSLQNTRSFAARATMKFFVCPRLKGTRFSLDSHKVAGGSATVIRALEQRLRRTSLQTNSDVAAIRKVDGRFVLSESNGTGQHFDIVVLTTPAYQTRRIIAELPGIDALRRVLESYRFVDTSIAIHSDRRYMPPRRSEWGLVNNIIDERGECQKTFWSGIKDGVDIFRSWVTLSPAGPRDPYGIFQYKHPIMSPDYFRAQRELAKHQGLGGLLLAGSYLMDIDTHESGLRSAIDVAQHLCPDSRNYRVVRR